MVRGEAVGSSGITVTLRFKGDEMTNWLKQNWGKVIVGFIIVFLLYGGINGLVSKLQYKKQIKGLDSDISELQQGIKDSKGREEAWEKSSNENYALAMDKEAKLRRKDTEMRVKIAEKRALKKKIREMPVTQVVVRTIEIIQCDDVAEQTQGIVFTLDCSKKNLTVLEASFSLKRDVTDWMEKFNTSQAEVSDLKNVITDKDGVIKEVREQLVGEDKITLKWEGKFNLSEKRGKRSWWRGLKTGGTIGGIAGFFLGFLLGK